MRLRSYRPTSGRYWFCATSPGSRRWRLQHAWAAQKVPSTACTTVDAARYERSWSVVERPRRRPARIGAAGDASRDATAVYVGEVVQDGERDKLVGRDPLAFGLLVECLRSEPLERQRHAAVGVLAVSLSGTWLAHLWTDRVAAHSRTTVSDGQSLRSIPIARKGYRCFSPARSAQISRVVCQRVGADDSSRVRRSNVQIGAARSATSALSPMSCLRFPAGGVGICLRAQGM